MKSQYYVQVGTGRLGGLIASQASTLFVQTEFVRLDPVRGLDGMTASYPVTVDRLVICISPAQKNKLNSQSCQWNEIFAGFVQQVADKQIKVRQIIFISSTRVFDGIDQGLIDSKTNAIAQSKRAKYLLFAENQLLNLAPSVHIVRCSGLYGQGYNTYSKILEKTSERPRFGVKIETVVKKVAQILKEPIGRSEHYLLTDGFCHHKGEAINIDDIALLATKYRLLINS